MEKLVTDRDSMGFSKVLKFLAWKIFKTLCPMAKLMYSFFARLARKHPCLKSRNHLCVWWPRRSPPCGNSLYVTGGQRGGRILGSSRMDSLCFGRETPWCNIQPCWLGAHHVSMVNTWMLGLRGSDERCAQQRILTAVRRWLAGLGVVMMGSIMGWIMGCWHLINDDALSKSEWYLPLWKIVSEVGGKQRPYGQVRRRILLEISHYHLRRLHGRDRPNS